MSAEAELCTSADRAEHDLRDIMDAILHVDRTGVQWRHLPHDVPPWNTVYGYFAKWADEGAFAQLDGLLPRLLRKEEGGTVNRRRA